MADLIVDLELADALAKAPFSEFHKRVVSKPIDEVWPACLDVAASEVRLLGPLMALRSLPSVLMRRTGIAMGQTQPLLEVFVEAGFMLLRRDTEVVDGRAVVLFGAVGKFWSITGNHPLEFGSPDEFLAFEEPGYAKTVCRLEAIDLGDGTTRIETETLVSGTDPASTTKFAPYWAIIRGPSGLIRRSWLGGIDRRVHSEH